MTAAATAPPPSPPCPRSYAASGTAGYNSSPSPPHRSDHETRPASRNRTAPGCNKRQRTRSAASPLADRVANAHREGGENVSPAERAALEEIAASLDLPAP